MNACKMFLNIAICRRRRLAAGLSAAVPFLLLTLTPVAIAATAAAAAAPGPALAAPPAAALDQPPAGAPWPPDEIALWEKPPPLVGGPLAAPAATEPDPGPRGYDVLDYDLDLTLLVAEQAVRGRVGILLRALADTLRTVKLDLVQDLGVDSAAWAVEPAAAAGAPAAVIAPRPVGAAPAAVAAPAPFTHAGDSVVVTLPEPLPRGSAGRLEVAWHGRPPRHGALQAGLLFRRHGDETPDPADGGPAVASISEPWSAHSWWPCKDHPADKATATIAVTAPDTLAVIANGALLGTSAPAPGWRRTVWRESYPLATYLVSVAASNYAEWSQSCAAAAGPLALSYHVFPQDEANARVDLAPTCDMLRFLEELAGPYPFAGEKYAQAAVRWGGAMENQTATSLGQFVFTGDRRHEQVIVHELAHSWFGNSISPARWADLWLNEGFARYVQALWLERTAGRDAYFALLRRIGPERNPDLFTADGVLVDPIPVLPNLLVYDKGAWVLHMLRGWLGDARFFAAVRAWATGPERAYGNASTADFVAAVSASAGEDLGPVLRPWLETAEVPELAWRATVKPSARPGWSRVELAVQQRQPTLFALALPVRLMTEGGARLERAVLTRRQQSFVWEVFGREARVELDPEGWVLRREASAPPPPLSIVAVAPNPAPGDGVEVRFALAAAARVAAALYDARGRLVGRWDLGERPGATPDAPAQSWRWEGDDGAGRPAPSGVYWLALSAAGERAVQRLALLR